MTEKDDKHRATNKAGSKGAIDGIGGAGGSSGAGAVRAKAHDPGAVSGIDDIGDNAESSETDDLPNVGTGSGSTSGKHRNMAGESAIPGKTRGAVSETIRAPIDKAREND